MNNVYGDFQICISVPLNLKIEKNGTVSKFKPATKHTREGNIITT